MSNPAWTIPDEEPVTCEGGCGLRAYDTDTWFQDLTGTYCPECWREEPTC